MDSPSLVHHRPGPPLDRFVEAFWWSWRGQAQPHAEHMLPSGRVHLVFALHEAPIVLRPRDAVQPEPWTASIVHGPQWTYYVAGPKPCGAVVGVSFRPGCAGAVLGVAMQDLVDRHVSLAALWGRRADDLRERLMAAARPPAVFEVLEQALRLRIQPALLMHPAVAHALASSWLPARISDLQREAGFSPRHFGALFAAAVGLTPKHYFRIQRFDEVARRLAGGDRTLADLAALAGYSDQAHLTREFRELAGVTPTRYRGHAESPLHHRAET